MRSVKYNPKKNIIGLSERGDPVSKVRQVLYLVLECCIFVVLAIVPGVFALQKNVFRQLPLYRFLEGQAVEDLQRQDQETYEKLVESNTRYLGKMVREENRDARVTPEITKTPQITESVKNELEDMRAYVEVGEGTIEESQTEDVDWVNNWKKYFHQFYVDDILIVPSWEEIKEMILRHTRMQIELKGEFTGIREMRKHIAWYTAGMKHSVGLRRDSNLVSSYEELEKLLDFRG